MKPFFSLIALCLICSAQSHAADIHDLLDAAAQQPGFEVSAMSVQESNLQKDCQPASKIDPPRVKHLGFISCFPLGHLHSASALFHSPGVVSGLDNLAVMRQPVQHGGGHLLVPEDLRPLTEGKVGGDHQRGLLIELGYQVEQQLTAIFRKGQIPQLIEHDQIEAQQPPNQLSAIAGKLLLLQVIGKVYEVVEPHP